MATIHVVGLGPGDISGIPVGVLHLFESGLPIYLRTNRHPAVDGLLSRNVQFETFDSVYETRDTFADVYTDIAQILFAKAAKLGDIIYAVPGHPLVAEQSVQNLIYGQTSQITVKIGPGQSFLDSVCQAVSINPIDGFVLLDGTSLSLQDLLPRMHTFIGQVYDRAVASDVKLTLMNIYPDEYLVTVIRAAGVAGLERIATVPLFELDRLEWIDHLTTVYIPKTGEPGILARDPWYVAGIVDRLRNPDGCQWDKEQTHASLRPYAIEEAYEVAEAIDRDNPLDLAAELGDLYLQVLLHARIASEMGDFTIRDVYQLLADKLVRRHPHVFGENRVKSATEAEKSWQEAKQEESGQDEASKSKLASVKQGRPAFWRAEEVQKCAAKSGFDWNNARQVLEKVKEEMNEIEVEFDRGRFDLAKEELGDLLFAAVNLARWIHANPETILAQATQKFEKRFNHVEQRVREKGNNWSLFSPEQLNSFWNEAKMKSNHKN
jgi:tetrapyrrole methylase family protein / MazG family protein